MSVIEHLVREVFFEAWKKTQPIVSFIQSQFLWAIQAKNFFEGFQNIYVGKYEE